MEKKPHEEEEARKPEGEEGKGRGRLGTSTEKASDD